MVRDLTDVVVWNGGKVKLGLSGSCCLQYFFKFCVMYVFV